LMNLIGPRRLDAFRNHLFRMKLARLLIHGQLRSSKGRSASIVCLILTIGTVILV
jgi:hypothetical protein